MRLNCSFHMWRIWQYCMTITISRTSFRAEQSSILLVLVQNTDSHCTVIRSRITYKQAIDLLVYLSSLIKRRGIVKVDLWESFSSDVQSRRYMLQLTVYKRKLNNVTSYIKHICLSMIKLWMVRLFTCYSNGLNW